MIFASGVSNSRETRRQEFEREEQLFRQETSRWPEATLVYFSTCSILDEDLNNTPYVRHKMSMEALASRQRSFHIFRLPLVVGCSDNPCTLTNFFYDRLIKQLPITVWEGTERNLIDVQDVYKIASHIINNRLMLRQTANVATPANTRVTDILAMMCSVTGRTSDVTLEKGHQGSRYVIDISPVRPVMDRLSITFDDKYCFSVLRKYYENRSPATA